MPVLVPMAFKDEINYEKISQLNKKERKSSKLIPLDPNFYKELIEHLKMLQDEYNKKYLESPTSAEALLLNNEICKLDNMIKEIYSRRERKIVLSALDINTPPNFKQMLEHEQKLHRSITKLLGDYREVVLNQKPAPECETLEKSQTQNIHPIDTSPKSPSPEQEPPPESHPIPVFQEKSKPTATVSPPEETSKPKSEVNQTTDEEQAIVLVLEDLEPFKGTDLVTYNLQKQDLATLPKSIAELLNKKNKVRILETKV